MGPRTGARVMAYGRTTSRSHALTQTARHRRHLPQAAALAVVLSMLALMPALVAPVMGVTCNGRTTVENGGVTPGSGTTSTTFHFSVDYSRPLDNQAGEVQLRIDGGAWQTIATNLPDGGTATASSTASVGSHTYAFQARRMGGQSWCLLTAVSPGSFTVTAPTPKPTPKPTKKPTPKPTKKPAATAKATAKPTPKPTKKPVTAAANPTIRPPKASPSAGAVVEPSPSPSPSAETAAVDPGAGPTPFDPNTAPQPTNSPTTAGAASVGGGDDGSGDGNGAPLGFDLGFVTNPNPFLAWLIASAGGVLLFLFLMRRSRQQDEKGGGGGLVLAAAFPTTSGDGMRMPIPGASLGGGRPAPKSAPAAAVAAATVAPPPKKTNSKKDKAAKAAPPKPADYAKAVDASKAADAPKPADRKMKPMPPLPEVSDDAPLASYVAETAAARAKVAAQGEPAIRTFDKPPAKGVERVKMSYRRVRLSEGPDDVGSRELDRLDRGDEVEILGSFEGFLQVRTPEGVEGWIPRHTIA